MPPPGRRRTSSRSRRIRIVLWSVAAFFALGYFPTMLLGNPVPSIALAACLVIPYGSKSASVRQAAVRGACLGGVAGLAATFAVAALLMQTRAPAATQPAGPASATTRPDKPAVPPATAASQPGRGRRVQVDLAAIGSQLIGGTVVLCACVAALFAYLAQKRRQRIEEEWRE